MSIVKRKAGSEDIVKSVLEFDAVPTEGSPNLVESGSVAQAIGNLGQPLQWKGPATVAELNAGITGIQPGWTYTLTDAGTLTDGSIAVDVGDEVAWTEDGEWFQVGPSLVELKADVAQAKSDIANIQDVVPEEASDSNKLVTKDELDNVQESIQSGFTPKGEISVSDLNDLTTQSNGDQYILTDSGTITEGSVTVEAGDSVAWNSTDSVWYKVNQYALSKYGTDEIKNLPTSITAFRTGDVIPVDGPSGTAKMSKDDFLRETAQNSLAGNVAQEFDPTRTSDNPYLPNQWVVKDGLLYKVKNSHYGAWVAADFTRSSLFDFFTDGFFATPVTPYDIIVKKYVNNAGELTADINFNVYVFEVKQGNYISFTAAPGGGWIEFTDEEFNIVGSVFRIRNWYHLDKYAFYKVPEGAAYIRMTSTTMYGETPTLVSHFDGANEIKLFQKLKQLAINDEDLQDVFLKSPASTIAPVARKNKNLFSNDLVGNFAIVRDTGLLSPVDNYPQYKAAIIKVAAGNYTISGYGAYDQWCVGLWDKKFNRIAVKTDQIVDDPNSLITIPEGESWGTATKVNVSVPSNCYLIVNLLDWETKWASAQFQVEVGTEATAFVEGLKLLPYYATLKDLGQKSLQGKKLLFIGDSLTAADRTTAALENNYGCYIYNRGASGTCVANRSGYSSSFCQRFDLAENNAKGPNSNGFPNRSNIDAVIVWGGINDWGTSVPIGVVDGIVDKETLFGAYKYLLEGLKTRYYGKPIIVCSVHNTARSTRFTNWNRAIFNNDGSFTFRTNSQGKMLSDYHDAQKAICDIFGVLFVDMFECGVSFMSEYDLEHYSYVQGDPAAPDGLHFNDAGSEIVAQYLSSIIANAL